MYHAHASPNLSYQGGNQDPKRQKPEHSAPKLVCTSTECREKPPDDSSRKKISVFMRKRHIPNNGKGPELHTIPMTLPLDTEAANSLGQQEGTVIVIGQAILQLTTNEQVIMKY